MEAGIMRIPSLRLRIAAAGLLSAFALAAAHADITRDEALRALDSPDTGARKEAVAELAKIGSPADAAALLPALHDEDGEVRELAEAAVWQVWLRSGDPEVDAVLRRGMDDMAHGKMGAAVDAFTRVIERRPDFAEGWNKRATAYFMIGDFDQSLQDCAETLKRNPDHFGALAGCGMIYAQREDLEHALEYFERALAINPNLKGVEQGLELVRYRLGKSGTHET